MLLPLLSIFLLYVGMTLAMRIFIAAIAGSGLLSIESRIFFSAFLPTVLFLSFVLLLDSDPHWFTMLFMLLFVIGRVIVLLVDGNQYLQAIILNDETVQIVYRTDFLKQKVWTVSLQSIRSVKLDHAERLIDFPCRLRLVLRNGSSVKLLIIDRLYLQQQEEAILELVKRLEFTEK